MALGGTPGLMWPGAAGRGGPPWVLAAALSLLLVSAQRLDPAPAVLAAGWFATAFVASIGPAACWSLVTH